MPRAVWLGLLLLTAGPAWAGPPPGKVVDAGAALGMLGGGSPEALAGSLRAFLVKSVPDPLFEDHRHWDLHKEGSRGKPKKDGRWWRVTVKAINPADTMIVDLRDLQVLEGGRKTFTLFVAFDADVELERQTWKLGVRLYSGSTRARLRLKLHLRCEALAKVEAKKLVPSAVFRLRVLESSLNYDNLVVEHTAGVGGEVAKLLGDAFVGGMHHWKPSLERELLAKANAAIVKAADTHEVRVGLGGWLGEQKK
jgi:hypothetical protein